MSIIDPMDNQRKEAIELHVSGEFKIFSLCYKRLNENMQEPDLRINLESFLLHARNLFDFLTTSIEKRDKKANKFGDRDIIAADFIDGEMQINFSGDIKSRINRQLHHISYSRSSSDQIDLYKEKDAIFNLIKNGIEEFDKKLPSEFSGILLK